MKKITIKVILITLLTHTAFAQPKNANVLPTTISAAFFNKYPDAKVKNWQLANNTYGVKYRSHNKTHTAYFSANGQWLKNETSFTFTHSLPLKIKNGLAANGFASFYFEEIKEIDTVGNHYFAFRADSYPPSPNEDRDFFKQYDVQLSADGKLIKKKLLPFD
jgi:hypothetical protein